MRDVGEEKNEDEVLGEDENQGEDAASKSKVFKANKKLGEQLYSALHLLLYTGSYRLLPVRDFPHELGVGYGLELFLSVIPNLFC